MWIQSFLRAFGMAVTTSRKLFFISAVFVPILLLKGSIANHVLEDRIGIGVQRHPYQYNKHLQYQQKHKLNIIPKANKLYIPRMVGTNRHKVQSNLFIQDITKSTKKLRHHTSFSPSYKYPRKSKSTPRKISVTQRQNPIPIYEKRNFLWNSNFRKHRADNKLFSKSDSNVASANVVTKRHPREKHSLSTSKDKRKGKKQSQSQTHLSRITLDEDLILQNELELKIQQQREKNERFQRLLQQLENNGYKELQKVRQERDALRYAAASNDKKVPEVENQESLINDGQQNVANYELTFGGQKWANR